MADLEQEAVDAQRAMDQAWACLQAYRERVDVRRQRDRQPPIEGRPSPLRSWTVREDEVFGRLRARALAAGQGRAAVMRKHDITSTWAVEHALRAAARHAEPE